MLKPKAPIGTKDVLVTDSYKWHYVEDAIKSVVRCFGYREIRTPVFEHTELFMRGVGDTTDIVQKEMYTFTDKGGRSITLKPEGTAGVVRSFIEHGLSSTPQPVKLYYISPIFRYERPQAGRLRQHHQFGIEVFGSRSATVDAEVIALAYSLLSRLGIDGLSLYINSIGCPDCRPAYNSKLSGYIRENVNLMCDTCRERIARNPLRVLDCKEERCQKIIAGAPRTVDNLCGDCASHFEALKVLLDNLGIRYQVNPLIVRGLDYYTKTVFEITSDSLGAQSTVCGGGRYDRLVESLGGPDVPGAGFGMGLERLLIMLEKQGKLPEEPPLTDIYIASTGERAAEYAFRLTNELRESGISCECDHMNRSLSAQMKYANRVRARHVVIIGDDEMHKGRFKIKDMAIGQEDYISKDELGLFGGKRKWLKE